jgi:hypothetical protein
MYYGITPKRLDWLRVGKVDGRPADNSPKLLLTNGYLPRVDARGDPKNAPAMDLFGALMRRRRTRSSPETPERTETSD